ncbi:hypothetical protein J6590_067796 [Homalodisca vitripennis]|nr:hypothetical protein J6590_067796 [Homalodisca vitripennis]
MPMDTVCRVLSSCMVHKILTIEEPQYLRERLLYRDQVSQRASRHGGNLNLPRVNLELGRKSFSYFGPKVYNDLPDGLKVSLSNRISLKVLIRSASVTVRTQPALSLSTYFTITSHFYISLNISYPCYLTPTSNLYISLNISHPYFSPPYLTQHISPLFLTSISHPHPYFSHQHLTPISHLYISLKISRPYISPQHLTPKPHSLSQ